MIRWTKEVAAREFAINPRTLADRIAQFGLLPGKDKKFSTKQVCNAVYGDLDSEKLRNATLDGDLKEIEKQQELRNWVPVAAVDRVWTGIAAEIVQKISQLDIPQDKKEDLCESLQAIPTDEYFSDTGKGAEETDGEISPAAQT